MTAYFSDLKPTRKRESEWQAFQELRKEYSEADIVGCVEWVNKHGASEGQPCHSPMAYLAIAMNDILTQVRENAAIEAKRAAAAAQIAQSALKQAQAEAIEAQEHEIQLQAFRRAHAGRNEVEVITEINREHGFPIITGQIGLSFAISQWWRGLSDRERVLATREATAC